MSLVYADLGRRTQIRVRGGDRAKFLHGLCTNDVKSLSPGQGRECFFTNVQGKTIGHAFLFCGDDAIHIDTTPGQAAALLPHLDRYIIREDVQLVDESGTRREFVLFFEHSAPVAGHFGLGFPAGRLDHADTPFDGITVDMRLVDWTGRDCWFLSCAAEETDRLRALLSKMLEASRDALEQLPSIGPEVDAMGWIEAPFFFECSEDQIEARRIAYGMPYFGRDITAANLPQEVARDRHAISFNKGCYIGQETVARIDALGHVNRYLVRLRIAADDPPAPGTPLLAEGAEKPVGEITSSARSPHRERVVALGVVALGYVRRGHHTAGTRLSAAGAIASVIGPSE